MVELGYKEYVEALCEKEQMEYNTIHCAHSQYVFCWSDEDIHRNPNTPVGAPYNPDYICRIFSKMKHDYEKDTKQDLGNFSFHKLRHSTASILFDLGLSIEQVQEILGHSDSAVTRKIYIHKNRHYLDRHAEMLNQLGELLST